MPDTPISKAFWLGRYCQILSFRKAMDARGKTNPDDDSLDRVIRLTSGFARALNIALTDIPAGTSKEEISKFTEQMKLDLAIAQSQAVGDCFEFGFLFSAWLETRCGYTIKDDVAVSVYPDLDYAAVEGNLDKARQRLGLQPQVIEACLSAAKNPSMSEQAFRHWALIDHITAIETELDKQAQTRAVVVGDVDPSKTVFVVMRMSQNQVHGTASIPASEDALDAISQAASSCGLEAYRVDQLEISGRITDSIVEGLRKAKLVVVDLTMLSSNVYWEAGFSHGLGKLPIYIAAKGAGELPFDIKDYPVIYYDSIRSLREQLTRRMRNLIGGA
jgi:hypothetical protein